MSDISPVKGVHNAAPSHLMLPVVSNDRSHRRHWITPVLAPHSTMTVLTQSALPVPLNLLFFQSSRQCFDKDGVPIIPCP